MEISSEQHLEAATVLVGRTEAEAKVFLERLQGRSSQFSFWGDVNQDAVVLVARSAGSVATFMISPSTKKNKSSLQHAIVEAKNGTAKLGVATAHAIVSPQDHASAGAFVSAGFAKLAMLRTMELNVSQGSKASFVDELEFVHASEVCDDDFCKVLQDSYIGSLDCPAIHGHRNVEDIIASHRGADSYDPSLWYLLLLRNTQAGVLFLHQSSDGRHLELDYLGIRPQARRGGVGQAAVTHAVNQAIDRGCDQIKLTVDDANEPAIRLYKKAMFKTISIRNALFCPLA